MEGPLVYTGRVVDVRDGPGGRVGRVGIGGARVEVALALVPEAKAGDDVLVHAGVALSVVRDEPGARDAGEQGD